MSRSSELTGKLIIVGPAGVGKTSLLSQFFEALDNNPQPTVAPALCTATVEYEPGHKVQLEIWDTAGQEQFQAITAPFFRGANVAFVCYLPSDKQTIELWISRVHEHAPECKMILVAMKSDLLSEAERFAFVDDQEKLMKQHDAYGNFLTSALSGENVHEVFQRAGQLAAAANNPPRQIAEPAPKRANGEACC